MILIYKFIYYKFYNNWRAIKRFYNKNKIKLLAFLTAFILGGIEFLLIKLSDNPTLHCTMALGLFLQPILIGLIAFPFISLQKYKTSEFLFNLMIGTVFQFFYLCFLPN